MDAELLSLTPQPGTRSTAASANRLEMRTVLAAECPGLSSALGCCLESSEIAQPPPRELVSGRAGGVQPHPDLLTSTGGEGTLEVGHLDLQFFFSLG